MILGEVTPDGQPRIFLAVDGRDWPALIDKTVVETKVQVLT